MTDTSFICPDPDDGRWISWAQNSEDVILKRIFGHQTKGFWIDIGANHPLRDSVTKNLYDSGWSGINVEPIPYFFDLLEMHRIRDVNLRCAVGAEKGKISFCLNLRNLDLSHIDQGNGDDKEDDLYSVIDVPITTINEIFWSSVPPERSVDFLKIDVEGFEVEVLRGCDLKLIKPKLVLVETSTSTRDTVIEMCVSEGLIHCHWDGVNDWFSDEVLARSFDESTWRPTHPVLDGYHPWIYQVIISDLQRQVEFDRKTIESLAKEKNL